MNKWYLLVIVCLMSSALLAQERHFLKVHFLYGSKPARQYKDSEPKWFGGKLGGHVGIESDSDRIVNFLPQGKHHLFAKNKQPQSRFAVHAADNFYGILGGDPATVKAAVVIIPISAEEKKMLDSITQAYLQKTPYDYAVFGMRCGAAGYDILAQLGIVKTLGYSSMYKKIFYPRRLRKRLFKQARSMGWTITRQTGSSRRKWEKD
jgi:hypothetical protein